MYEFKKSLSTLDRYLTPEFTAENILPSGFDFFDKAFSGFRCSNIHLINTSQIFLDYFVYRAMARNILQFDREVVFVDCGNSFSPYAIARMCRENGVDEKAILQRILISRPFTAYQLNPLIEDGLREVLQRKPVMLVFSHFLDLFYSDDVKKRDAEIILRRVLKDIKDLTNRDFATILTNRRYGRRKKYLSILAGVADSVFYIQTFRKNRIRVHLEKDPVFYPKIVDFAFAYGTQTTLDQFLEE